MPPPYLQLEEDFITSNPEWVSELELMLRTKEKAEIQALSSFGFQYLSQVGGGARCIDVFGRGGGGRAIGQPAMS